MDGGEAAEAINAADKGEVAATVAVGVKGTAMSIGNAYTTEAMGDGGVFKIET